MQIRRSLTSTVSADEGVNHPLAQGAEKGRLRRKREPGDLPCGAIVLLLGGEDQTCRCTGSFHLERARFVSQKPREVDDLSDFEHYISVGRERLRCGYTTGDRKSVV